MLPRKRAATSLEVVPSTTSGVPAPSPNTNISNATCSRCEPWAAKVDAAPSVGPTQGAQTRPSSKPTANCPLQPSPLNRDNKLLPDAPRPAVATANPSWSLRDQRTSPKAISITAATCRITSWSSPIDTPIVAMNKPTSVNKTAKPAASAKGPYRCCESAVATRIGISGNTQGDRIDKTPVAYLRGLQRKPLPKQVPWRVAWKGGS